MARNGKTPGNRRASPRSFLPQEMFNVVKFGSTERGIDAAFATFGQRHADALLVADDPFFFTRRERIVSLVARYAVPMLSSIQRASRRRRTKLPGAPWFARGFANSPWNPKNVADDAPRSFSGMAHAPVAAPPEFDSVQIEVRRQSGFHLLSNCRNRAHDSSAGRAPACRRSPARRPTGASPR